MYLPETYQSKFEYLSCVIVIFHPDNLEIENYLTFKMHNTNFTVRSIFSQEFLAEYF